MPTDVRCPKCSVEMNEMSLLNTVIDVCPLCNGCWLDRNELARITRSRGDKALSIKVMDKKPTPFRCPRCRGPLQEGYHERKNDFFIDECDLCGGIWLDRGELPTLLTTQ